MSTLYALIGPPAIGKSTWIQKHAPHAKVMSRDDVIERLTHKIGFTYDDAYVAPPQEGVSVGDTIPGMERFGKVVPSDRKWRAFDFEIPQNLHKQAEQELRNAASSYAKSDNDVVLDMTNMNREDRALFMPMFQNHRKVAVVFNFQNDKIIAALKKKAEQRAKELAKQGRNKTIPAQVIDRMVATYEPPTESEGFDEITTYDNVEHLLNMESIRRQVRSIINEHRTQHRDHSVRPNEHDQEA